MKRKDFDWDVLDSLDLEQRAKVLSKLAHRANQRLRELEKAGETYYAYNYAKSVSKNKNKPRFKESVVKDKYELNTLEKKLKTFLTAPSSTIAGLRKIRKEQSERLEKDFGITDIEHFKGFVKSEEYKNLVRFYDSNQLFDLYALWQDSDENFTFFMKSLNESLNKDIPIEDVEERIKDSIAHKSKYNI